ncbi:MAG: SHOCT domain-containing protein [Erysipelotrichales bacterium]|nr:SHOCT domain-containing protein [Erysipelotrichales bacterium]
MSLKSVNCPNCGAHVNPSTMQCEYCGSYIITSNEKYVDFSQLNFVEDEKNEKYKGIYVFGTLLGKGERPVNLGAANYYTSTFFNVGGKLLLTNKTLSFSSHTFMQSKTDVVIKLEDVDSAIVSSNSLISQTITVTANMKKHKFVVYHGKEWVTMILNEKLKLGNKNNQSSQSVSTTKDYIIELQQLKGLLDAGIITQDEFNAKKKEILNN